MNTDSYIILQLLHTPWQELIVPEPKNSSTCDLWLGGRMYQASWESTHRKVMSEETISLARMRSENLRVKR